MKWLILLNFIGTLVSYRIIWRGFCEIDSSDVVLGVICLTVNLSCLVFNLSRELFDN